ncbi:hypothetical protein Tco_1415188 [Tanacetum coccineum]
MRKLACYPPLNEYLSENAKERENTLLGAARKDGDEVIGKDAQVSCEGLVTKATKIHKSSVTALKICQAKQTSSYL